MKILKHKWLKWKQLQTLRAKMYFSVFFFFNLIENLDENITNE